MLGRRRRLALQPEPEPEPEPEPHQVASLAQRLSTNAAAPAPALAAGARAQASAATEAAEGRDERHVGAASSGGGSLADRESRSAGAGEPDGDEVSLQFGADEAGTLGVSLRAVSIESIDPEGEAARAPGGVELREGMLLQSINGLRADQLAFNAIVGVSRGGLGGLSLAFVRDAAAAQAARQDDEDEEEGQLQREARATAGGGEALVTLEIAAAASAGRLGITWRRVSVETVDPDGMAAARAGPALQPGAILTSVNDVPADRLAYDAILQLVGDLSGLSLTFTSEPDDASSWASSYDTEEWPSGAVEDLFEECAALERLAPSLSPEQLAVLGLQGPGHLFPQRPASARRGQEGSGRPGSADSLASLEDSAVGDIGDGLDDSSLVAEDFATLTAMLDAVDDEQQPADLVSIPNRGYDEILEAGSTASSTDAHEGRLEDEPAAEVVLEVPMGGMPCAPGPTVDDSQYDHLQVPKQPEPASPSGTLRNSDSPCRG